MKIKKLTFTIYTLITAVLLIELNSCNSQKQFSPEQMITRFFYCWNSKDQKGIIELLSDEHQKGKAQWEFDKIDFVKIIEFKDCTKTKKELYLMYGRGRITKPFDVKVYCTKFQFKYKNGKSGAMNNGTYDWMFNIIKPDSTSGWRIDNWGY